MNKIKIISLTAVFLAVIVFAIKSPLSAFSSDDLVTLKGVFTDVNRPNVTFKADDGSEYLVHIGPVWYWEDNGYSLSINSGSEIYGKLETGKNEIYAYTITLDGKTIKLANEKGEPLWWNDGKGKNRGNGWGMGNGRGCRCNRWK